MCVRYMCTVPLCIPLYAFVSVLFILYVGFPFYRTRKIFGRCFIFTWSPLVYNKYKLPSLNIKVRFGFRSTLLIALRQNCNSLRKIFRVFVLSNLLSPMFKCKIWLYWACKKRAPAVLSKIYWECFYFRFSYSRYPISNNFNNNSLICTFKVHLHVVAWDSLRSGSLNRLTVRPEFLAPVFIEPISVRYIMVL